MNIYDFITDEEQFRLKSQSSNNIERFENILENYKNLFFRELANCQNNPLPTRLNQNLVQNQSILDWLSCFNNAIQQDIDNLKALFDDIIYGYKLFLKGKHYFSCLHYQDILEKYGILIDEDLDKLGLFYRGFWKSKNRDSNDKMQYFHIPYGMRQLVGNQRFSFSGIPLIYLGSSIADVYYELGETDLNSKKLTIASFSFNPISSITLHQGSNTVQTKTRIFNITNEIYNLINRHFELLINSGLNIPDCTNQTYRPNHLDLVLYFRKFVLSQLCTFPKRYTSDKFFEEYVIPQLFTEALYAHKYDGIIFPSTRFYTQTVQLTAPPYNLGYKENLVMFTTYSETDEYDQMLLSNFEINIKTLRGLTNNFTQRFVTQIATDSQDIPILLYNKQNDIKKKRIQEGAMEAGNRIVQYQNLSLNNIPYLNTRAGMLELIFTRDYFRYLKRNIRYLNVV